MTFGVGLGNRVGRLGAASAGAAAITLSGNTVSADATSGTVIGVLGVVRASGTPTFTLEDAGGLAVVVSGTDLQTNGALTAGTYTVQISVSGVTPSPPNGYFVITVTASPEQLPHFPILFN